MLDSIVDSRQMIDKVCRNRELKKEAFVKPVWDFNGKGKNMSEFELGENHDTDFCYIREYADEEDELGSSYDYQGAE
jgi:hypothetical protein